MGSFSSGSIWAAPSGVITICGSISWEDDSPLGIDFGLTCAVYESCIQLEIRYHFFKVFSTVNKM